MNNSDTCGRPGPGRAGRPRLRLAAFDLDGTLLGAERLLSEGVIRALRRLAQSGVTVIIVTGRMHVTAERFAATLGLSGLPLVSYNGAMVKVLGGDEVWWHQPVSSELALEVIDFLAERGLEPLVFSGDHVYASGPRPEVDQYCRIAIIRPEYVGDLRAWVAGSVEPTKLLQVYPTELMPSLLAAARERFGAVLNVTTSYTFFLEFMNRAVSKGKALAEVCRRLGVDRREVAAFGDGLNDLDMIEWAGLGVALAHGPEELLAAADFVAEGPPGEAVARFIEERLLAPGSRKR